MLGKSFKVFVVEIDYKELQKKFLYSVNPAERF